MYSTNSFQQASQIKLLERQAFGSDLQIGRIVYCRLKYLIEDYPKDDIRPMLVTGLWHNGDYLHKIEMMKLSSQGLRYSGPELFRAKNDIDKLPGFYGIKFNLETQKIIIADNDTCIFPSASNSDGEFINPQLWPDILARRAYSILYSENHQINGEIDRRFKRTGFSFQDIPEYAIRNKIFIPEIHVISSSPTSEPYAAVDVDIARFSAAFTQSMHKAGSNFFSFPPYKEWPVDIPFLGFKYWKTKSSGPRNLP